MTGRSRSTSVSFRFGSWSDASRGSPSAVSKFMSSWKPSRLKASTAPGAFVSPLVSCSVEVALAYPACV